LYTLIDHTADDLKDCIFNTNHVSNYLSLKGELGKDKRDFLSRVEAGIKDPAVRQPEYMRGLGYPLKAGQPLKSSVLAAC